MGWNKHSGGEAKEHPFVLNEAGRRITVESS
jgi:hypothetical protein